MSTWKYVDDTTVAEVVARNNHSNAQAAVNSLVGWSGTNLMQLNADKCKELVIDFKTHKHSFDPLYISSNSLTVVSSAKVLGLTISDDLSWNLHVSDIIRKANKRIFLDTFTQGRCPVFRHHLLLLHLHKTAFRILRSCVPSCYTKVSQRRLRENSETCLAHYYSR